MRKAGTQNHGTHICLTLSRDKPIRKRSGGPAHACERSINTSTQFCLHQSIKENQVSHAEQRKPQTKDAYP